LLTSRADDFDEGHVAIENLKAPADEIPAPTSSTTTARAEEFMT